MLSGKLPTLPMILGVVVSEVGAVLIAMAL